MLCAHVLTYIIYTLCMYGIYCRSHGWYVYTVHVILYSSCGACVHSISHILYVGMSLIHSVVLFGCSHVWYTHLSIQWTSFLESVKLYTYPRMLCTAFNDTIITYIFLLFSLIFYCAMYFTLQYTLLCSPEKVQCVIVILRITEKTTNVIMVDI